MYVIDNLMAQHCSESQLSNAAVDQLPRLPAQQPKTRSAYDAHSHYEVLGSICYAI